MKWNTPLSLERMALAAIVMVYAVAGLLYSVSSPFLEVSDEVRHYALVEHLAQGNGLPVQDPEHHGFYEQEGSQPPLYYALMALLAQPFDRSDFAQLAQFNPHARLGRADTTSNWNQLIHTPAEQWPWQGTVLVVHLIRWLGLAMGAVTAVCAYALAGEFAGRRPGGTAGPVGLLAAACVAFNPMFIFISASVNNDTLAAMLSSLALVLGARAIRRGLTLSRAAALGAVLGCAALTKASALALVAVIPTALALMELLRGGGLRAGLRRALARPFVGQMALLLALVAAIAGGWYGRNQVLYGDFTGTTMMAAIAGARPSPPSLLELLGEWEGFRQSFWGLFGAVNIPMAGWIYAALDGVAVLSAIGLALALIGAVRPRAGAAPPPADRWVVVLTGLGAVAVALAALVRWTSITLASQGRLMVPVIAVIAAFLALGLARLGRAAGAGSARRAGLVRLAGGAWLAGLAALALACPLVYIRPAYALPALLADEAQLPADTVKTEMRFGDGIRWIGYRVDQDRLRPGGDFGVTLYWQALQPLATHYSAFVKLYGRAGAEAVALDTYPGGGMWQTTLWQPGQIIADHYRLRLSGALTTPAVLRLDVGYWDFATRQYLPTYDMQGRPTGRQRYEVAGLAVAGSAQAAPGPRLSHATPVSLTTEQRDGKLWVTTRWVATQDFGEAFTLFMHLVDSQGGLVGQADGPAAQGDFPVRWWRAGDVIDDTRSIDLPPGTLPGDYQLEYGFYRPGDGWRLPAFDAQGQPIPDAAIRASVTVK